jgi:hypothetical protein
MSSKKKQPLRPYNPYEISLKHATKRLEEALAEQSACEKRLLMLRQEIPFLETAIYALTPLVTPPVPASPPVPTPAPAVTTSTVTNVTPFDSPVTLPGVPAHLERFLQHIQRPTAAPPPVPDSNPADDNAFLVDGSGTEVLP